MPKFLVHNGDPSHTYPAFMRDMGLCYVSKFIIEGAIIYSIASADASLDERLKCDDARLEESGYYIITGSIEP